MAFKNNSFGGKVDGKKITEYSKAFKAVADAQPGQTYEVATEKNGEFVEWVSLQQAGAVPVQQSAGNSRVSTPPAGAPPAAGRGFETPEERAKKQVYIVRQSSLSTAAAILSVGAKTAPSIDAVIRDAKRLESYVFGHGESGFDDIPDLDPSFAAADPQIE